MSAICGVINLDGDPISSKSIERMMDRLKNFPIDDHGLWIQGQAFIGNVIKYITPQCMLEKMPTENRESSLVITADAILDNREEVLARLNVEKSQWKSLADSEIILKTYLKYGEDCPKYLVGDYAFAIWDPKKRELFCARDHVGKRTLYYFYSKNLFAFCTVTSPLLEIESVTRDINEQWIADYLAIEGLLHELDASITIYQDIHQLLPGHSLKISKFECSIKKYWEPFDVKKLKLKSNEEYEEAFREVFDEAVKCRLRSTNEVGIMLSGGLDSSSVAAVAAINLKENQRKLNAYSAIPFTGYKEWLPKTQISNESYFIEELIKKYKNINIKYLSFDYSNPLSKINELIDMMEQPYKILQNLFWIDEMMAEAQKEGCSVMLNGQFGNYTISLGSISSYLFGLLNRKKYLSLHKEIKAHCQLHQVQYSKVFKYLVREKMPDKIKEYYYKLRNIETRQWEKEQTQLINMNFSKEFNIDHRLRDAKIGKYQEAARDILQTQRESLRSMTLSHISSTETKLSLKHGIALRDPTRDKRVIEFCLSLPDNQFVNNGQGRSLIRRSTKNILPDEIRLNYYRRGKQGADFSQRLSNFTEEIKMEIQHIIEHNKILRYMNMDRLNELLSFNEAANLEQRENMLRELLMVIILSRYINKFNEGVFC